MAPARKSSEQPDALGLAKKVFEVADIFRYTLVLVLILIIWAFAYLTVFVLGLLDTTGVYPAMVGILIVITIFAVVKLRDIVDGLRALKDWEEKYEAFAFLNVFEFAPRTGVHDSISEVVEKLRMIYPRVDDVLSDEPGAVHMGYAAKGKRGRSYKFDAAIDLGDSYVVMEFPNAGDAVGLDYMKEEFRKVSGLAKDTNDGLFEWLIISREGFTDDAIDYVDDEDHWLDDGRSGHIAPTLMKQTDDSYQIVWMEAMHVLRDVEEED